MSGETEKKVKEVHARDIEGEEQYSTFYVAGRLYGIEVTRVQEIVKPMQMTPIPLAPAWVRGLINLRGQVATAIGIRELYQLRDTPPDQFMNVVCKVGGSLISLQVDEIADVTHVHRSDYEPVPRTVAPEIHQFLDGVYKINNSLLSIISIDRVLDYLNRQNQQALKRAS